MKFEASLIAVKDIEAARTFYENILNQTVALDLGWNLSFEGGFALQMNFDQLVGEDGFAVSYHANDHELYFEEEDLDAFITHLEQHEIKYVHKAKEYPWGQRVIRFYDLDGHVIEVGESMASVFKRFHDQGMSVEAIAEKTMHPVDFVNKHIN